MLGVAGCVGGHSTQPVDHTAASAGNASDETLATQQFAQTKQLIADKNWPQALSALGAIIDAKSFLRLSRDFQYRVLSIAARTALQHGTAPVAYACFVRLTSFPQATFDDWVGRLNAAHKVGNDSDEVNTLTVLEQRWPEQSKAFNFEYVFQVIDNATQSAPHSLLPLLQALHDAHWKLTGDIEPSYPWRDLVLLLMESGRLPAAIDVSAHITDVYVLIEMRADRRFDAVVAANPQRFDIDKAAAREFHDLQAAVEKFPQSLALRAAVLKMLLAQQHYAAMLGAADDLITDFQSTNYRRRLFEDYDQQYPWILNLRATALERLGQWDDAVAQLTAASLLDENHRSNVSQLINLADLYCRLGRPLDARASLDKMVTETSPYGTMELESTKLDAAYQLGDTQEVERSLRYLREHRKDEPSTYEDALIVVNQLDGATHELVQELSDVNERREALLNIQNYAPTPGTPLEMEREARFRTVIARPEIQAAIRKVGRVESYRLEAP